MPLAVDLFRYIAGWATKIEGETHPDLGARATSRGYTLREPVGVVGQIIPWNFPLLMAAWKLGPALAAGCTVVLKPAEQTPLTALRLGELVLRGRHPDGVVNIVTGFGETAGAALAAHPDVDKVAFTGSTEVGKLIVQAAAGNLKKVSLELGGKSPNIVFADADLDAAIAGRRERDLLQPRPVLLRRLAALRRAADLRQGRRGRRRRTRSRSRSAPASIPQTEMGPLVSQEQLDRVMRLPRRRARRRARSAVTGGKRVGEQGLLRRADRARRHEAADEGRCARRSSARSSRRSRSRTPTRCCRRANDTIYGLAAGVWTRDIGQGAPHRRNQLRAGTVWINCYNVFDAALPFGGYKQSGWGREMGKEALELYTETKSVVTLL